MRRLATIALTLAFLFGLNAVGRLLAQDEPKKEAPKDDTKKDDTKKDEPAKSATDEPAPIPPEVEAKLEAARRAVAEAIVAAQDAGLVKTTIDPPPVLDILITGRADDETKLKGRSDANPEVGVSVEVFGAWYTGQGKMEGVVAEKNVRITPPSKGLIDFYNRRRDVMGRHLAEARKAKSAAPAPKAEEPKKEEPKPEEPKKAEEPKKEEPKKEEPKAEEPKKEEPKKEEAKPEEPKKEEPKADAPKEEPKKEEPKADAPKDEPKKEEPKPEEPKKEEPKPEEPKGL